LQALRILGLGAAVLLAGTTVVLAQGAPPQPPASVPGAAPASPQQNPVCVRLESQLASINNGLADPGRADQIRRYEEAAAKQQAELDRMVAQSRKQGCEGLGFFSLFSGQSQQCGPLNSQTQQMRGNLDRITADLERLKGSGTERDGQRQSVLVALAQNNCGPQYRSAVTQQSGGLFDTLFRSGGSSNQGSTLFGGDSQTATFRTLCVRTCDGFYYPISFSTTQDRFRDDEQVCQRTCPSAEVALYSHRNPGEDVNQAVGLNGALYTQLPAAFKYRTEFNAACSCRKAGQSWGEAMSQIKDTTVERGDIVVTTDRAKVMAQPRDAQGRPIKFDARNAPAASPAAQVTPAAAQPSDAAAAQSGDDAPPKRNVRSVGPTFYPVR
jgi:hypothetical protein